MIDLSELLNEIDILLFDYGAEGGSAQVLRRPNGTVYERGGSGGLLDDEDDPYRTWKHEFANWEAWWKKFTSVRSWYCFYPSFIAPEIRKSIAKALKDVGPEDEDDTWFGNRMERWQEAIKSNREL